MVAVVYGCDVGGGGPGGSGARGVCGRVLYSHPEGPGRGSLPLQLLSYRGNVALSSSPLSHPPLQMQKYVSSWRENLILPSSVPDPWHLVRMRMTNGSGSASLFFEGAFTSFFTLWHFTDKKSWRGHKTVVQVFLNFWLVDGRCRIRIRANRWCVRIQETQKHPDPEHFCPVLWVPNEQFQSGSRSFWFGIWSGSCSGWC